MERNRGTFRVNLAYAFLQAFYWCAYCAYFSFLVAYLLENGYPKPLIGLILMMLSALSVVVPLVAGYLVDFRIPIRGYVVVVVTLTIPAAFLLRFTVAILPLAVVSIACLGLLVRGQSSVLDSWAVKLHARGFDIRYGTTRGLASLAFAFTALGLGGLYARIGLDKLFLVHAVFAAGCVLAALALPGVPVVPGNRADRLSARAAFGLLLAVPRYRLLLICTTLTGIGSMNVVAFLPMRVESLGGTSRDLGLCLFVMAISETTLMMLYRPLARRFSAERMLSVAMFFIVVRVLALFFVPSIPWLVAAHAIQALAFGLYLPPLLMYIGQITDSRLQATAITILIASSEGVAGILGNAAGSAVIGWLGLRWVYVILGSVSFLGFLLFVVGQAAIVRRETDPPESPVPVPVP